MTTKIFALAIALILSIFLIPQVLSTDSPAVTPITKGPQMVILGDGIKISFDFNIDGNYDLEEGGMYSMPDDPIGIYEFAIKQGEDRIMSVTTTVQRRTNTPLSIDAPGSEQNSAGYKETQEKMIDGWPGTVSYTWAKDTTDRTLDNAKLVYFQFFPSGKKISNGIDGHVTVEGRIQGWNKPNGISGYRPIFEEVLNTIKVSGVA